MVACTFCMKIGDSNSMMQCGACQLANYCCKSCQVQDWKQHRPMCRDARQCKKDMVANNAKRQHRLFTIWKEKTPVIQILLLHYGVARLNEILNEKTAVVLNLEFDYNKRTFVPPHPPRLVRFSTFVQENPEFAAAVATHPKGIVTVLQYKDMKEVSLNTFRQLNNIPSIRGSSWEEVVEKFFPYGVETLTSSIFASWQPMQQQNFENQLNLVRQSPPYRHFIVNALRIKTIQPRHKTHVVMIHLKFGLGLGQIVALPDFQVLTLQEVKDIEHTESWWNSCQDWLNLDTHPLLLKARQQDPTVVRLPVFFNMQPVIRMIPIYFRIPYVMHDVVSQATADAKAQECFDELKNISMPTVSSPELH